LFVWIAEHRAQLEKTLRRDIQTEYAASDLAAKQSDRHRHFLDRIEKKIFNTIIPESLKTGPPPGDWRIMTQAARRYNYLFEAALVPVNGQEEGWKALEQAIVLAKRENTGLQGLYVVPVEEDIESPPGETVQGEFSQRCQAAQVRGELLVVSGQVSEQICRYAAFNDIVITNLAHPPGEQPLDRLSSGFRQLIQRCPRPVLATPHQVSPLNHALLAFDGSSKSREGMYIASYLVGKWGIRLTVVTIADQEQIAHEIISQAQEYLRDHGNSALYLSESGPIAETILKIAQSQQCDFLIMGGYGLNPLLEVMLGSTVDQVLRERKYPVLICR
jgi:nucleotide-binding universal stress UspA family protein